MMSDTMKSKLEKLGKYKYPLLVLLVGLMLMLLPSSTDKEKVTTDENELLSQILTSTDGVGDSKVLLSDNGVVIVCDGAENAKVRLDIIRAISSYTGFASSKITILKMAN
jgi:hypothetical protein